MADALNLDAAVPTFSRPPGGAHRRQPGRGRRRAARRTSGWCASARGPTRCSWARSRRAGRLAPWRCRSAARGCRLDAINLGGPATSRVGLNGVIRVTGISVDGQRLDGGDRGRGLGRGPGCVGRRHDPQRATPGDERSRWTSASGESDGLVQLDRRGARRAACPWSVEWTRRPAAPKGSFGETSATEFETRAALVGQSVPFLGPSGSMIDYSTLTTDRVIYRQKVPVYVLASDRHPDAVTQASAGPRPVGLHDAGRRPAHPRPGCLRAGPAALRRRGAAGPAHGAGRTVRQHRRPDAGTAPGRRVAAGGRRTPTVRDVGRGPRARRRPRRDGDRRSRGRHPRPVRRAAHGHARGRGVDHHPGPGRCRRLAASRRCCPRPRRCCSGRWRW